MRLPSSSKCASSCAGRASGPSSVLATGSPPMLRRFGVCLRCRELVVHVVLHFLLQRQKQWQ